jgi:hypothetical protein
MATAAARVRAPGGLKRRCTVRSMIFHTNKLGKEEMSEEKMKELATEFSEADKDTVRHPERPPASPSRGHESLALRFECAESSPGVGGAEQCIDEQELTGQISAYMTLCGLPWCWRDPL